MSLSCRLTFGFLVPLILNFLIVSAPTNPSGLTTRKVPQAITTYYYAHERYTTRKTYLKCDSWGRNCRTAYKLVYISRRVRKSRKTYVCPNGYKIIGNTCQHIKKKKTSNGKTTVTLAVSIPSGIVGFIILCGLAWYCYNRDPTGTKSASENLPMT